MSSNVTVVADQIDKPEVDSRSYRIVRLDNELEALLVHDPDTDKASAALDVHVGHLSDPPNAAGLAHFCEHLLFMGTEKYPKENDYSEFLSSHSGSSNAYTATVDTNYFFDVGYEHFEPALDRFSQFFICPLFLESCKDREVLAVDSENKKNLQNDTWRSYQLEKSLSNPHHVYSKFGTGNAETLKGENTRDELLKFHGELYSANQMKLVLLGRNSLDELQEMATSKFAAIKNKGIPSPMFEGQVLRRNRELGSVYTFKPVKEVRNLEICFPIPDCSHFWRSQPSHYFAHLIGHEGEGSILSYLKKQGWVLYLGAGGSDVSPGTDFFKITMELTLTGIQNWRSILEVTFAYINILKREGIEEWIWAENKLCSEAAFRFKDRQPASRFTSNVAGKMHYPIDKRYILGTSVPRVFVKEELEACLAAINHENFRVAIADPDVLADRKEKWYGTEYRLDRIPADLLHNCSPESSLVLPELHLPRKNDFIPENFETNRKDSDNKAKRPTLIKNSSVVRLHHKKDDTFWVPKANFLFLLRNPLYTSCVENAVMTKLFIELLKDGLNEYSYPADIAGLQYAIDPTVGGMTLTFSGYNDKMMVLLEKVLQKLTSLVIEENRFLIEKDRLERDLNNFEFTDPYQQVSYYMSYVLTKTAFTKEEQSAALQQLTLEQMRKYAAQMFEQLHAEILIHGNITQAIALQAAELFETIVAPSPIPEDETKALPALRLPIGSHATTRTLKDASNLNSAIEYFVQVGHAASEEQRALCSIFAQICSEPAFNQLRTKEQLGYIVFSGTKITLTSNGFRVLIQSERSTRFLATRIEHFLDFVKEHLTNLSTADFERQRQSLIDRMNEKLKNLGQESKRYWSHITTSLYDFDSIDVQTSILKSTTKEQVVRFFDEFVHYSSPKRRHFSMYIDAQVPEASQAATATEQVSLTSDAERGGKTTLVSDVQQFKDGCEVLDVRDGLSQYADLNREPSKL